MPTTLVTGAAGFVGSHLAEALLAAGDKVVGLDDFCPAYSRERKHRHLTAALADDRFRLVEGDIRDLGLVSRLVEREGVERVAHLAALAGVRDSFLHPDEVLSVDVNGTLSVARAAGGRPLVFASSSSVYGSRGGTEPFRESDAAERPVSPYAAAKRAAELLLHVHHAAEGAPVTVLRPFTVYGPRQRPDMAIPRFTASIEAAEPIPVFFDGEVVRDLTFVSDVVAAFVAALDDPAPWRVLNCGSGRAHRVADVISTLASLMGREADMVPRPAPLGDVPRTLADPAAAAAELGWSARVGLIEGLASYLEWRARGDEGPVEPAA